MHVWLEKSVVVIFPPVHSTSHVKFCSVFGFDNSEKRWPACKAAKSIIKKKNAPMRGNTQSYTFPKKHYYRESDFIS